jgi:hypothetical protein
LLCCGLWRVYCCCAVTVTVAVGHTGKCSASCLRTPPAWPASWQQSRA